MELQRKRAEALLRRPLIVLVLLLCLDRALVASPPAMRSAQEVNLLPLVRPLLPTVVDISILKQSPRVDAACRGRSTASVIKTAAP